MTAASRWLRENWRAATVITVAIGVMAVIFVRLVLPYYLGVPTYGEKEEDGVQVAYGTVAQMMSVHGSDWYMQIDSKPYIFEFEYGVLDTPNIGENVAIAYEWRRLYHEDSAPIDGDYNRHYYWAPLVLDWERVA